MEFTDYSCLSGLTFTDCFKHHRSAIHTLCVSYFAYGNGKFHGFELLVEKNFLGINYMVLRGKTEYKAELSTSPVGSMVKLENLFNGLHENIDFFEKKIEQYQNDLEASKAEYDKPFAYSKELEEKLARQCKLNAQLDLENAKAVDADLSGPEEEREADDRMESAAIVAEDKGAYPADREGRTR